jgi:hypothetical protein
MNTENNPRRVGRKAASPEVAKRKQITFRVTQQEYDEVYKKIPSSRDIPGEFREWLKSQTSPTIKVTIKAWEVSLTPLEARKLMQDILEQL